MLDFITSLLPALFSISDMLKDAAAGWYDDALGLGVMDSIYDMVSFAGSGSLDYSLYWSTINNFIEIVEPFGYALIATYFLMSLLDSAAKDNVTMDSVIKVLMELILVVALVGNLGTIINAMLNINESIIAGFTAPKNTYNSTTLSGADYVDALLESKDGHNLAMTSIFLNAFCMWIVHFVAMVGVTFAAISRALDIGWRCVLAPIGVANCFEGGLASPGVKYMKGLGASILSGAAIYIVTAIGMSFAGSALTGTINDPSDSKTLIAMAAMLATAGAAIGINNKAKEIVG